MITDTDSVYSALTAAQVEAMESLPQPCPALAIDDTGAALAVDVHGDAHRIAEDGETLPGGGHLHYRYVTSTAHAAAAAISRHARGEHLGDVCYGVAITRPDRPGWIAILATDPDRPATGWGVYAGDEDWASDPDGWTDIPDAWGTDPKAIGAAFARAYGRAR